MCTYIPLKVEEGHTFYPSEIWQLYLNGFFIYDFFSAQNKGKNQGKFGHWKNALKTEPSAQVQKCHISAISYFSLRNESILRKFVENCRPFSNIMATLTDIWK